MVPDGECVMAVSRHDSSFRDHALSARQASTAKPTLNEGQMSISGAEQRRGFHLSTLTKSGEGYEAEKKQKKKKEAEQVGNKKRARSR